MKQLKYLLVIVLSLIVTLVTVLFLILTNDSTQTPVVDASLATPTTHPRVARVTETPQPTPEATATTTPSSTPIPTREPSATPIVTVMPVETTVQPVGQMIVPAQSTWQFLDDGSAPAPAWKEITFMPTDWSQGQAELGYGDGDEQTEIGFSGEFENKNLTTYFRHTFTVDNPAMFTSLSLRLLRDDGAVVYLNGMEVFRSNMPASSITHTTPANTTIWDADEGQWLETELNPSLLLAGENIIAVEIHQATPGSSDLSFDLELMGITHLAFIPPGATWRYANGSTTPNPNWNALDYDDDRWQLGRAEFGFGDGDEVTLMQSGTTSTTAPLVTYFRHTFQVDNVASYDQSATLRLLRDDGAIVYLNGEEVFRSNMPDGELTTSMTALRSVWGDAQTIFHETAVPADLLRTGRNVMAVAVYQASSSSTDMSFNLSLLYDTQAPTAPSAPTVPAQTDTTLALTWDEATDTISVAGYYILRNGERIGATDKASFVDSNLTPSTTYEYTVQTFDSAGNLSPTSDSITATTRPPQTACTGDKTFAIIGDYGNEGDNAAAVADLIKSWNVDFIATVGDNNYPDGNADTIDDNIGQYYSDYIYPYRGEYGSGGTTNRFFPALGGHDWLTDEGQPYFDYFSLTRNYKYYQVRQGAVDLFILHSEPHEPDGIDADSEQAQWLARNVAASRAPWQIVLLHAPPFSSGDRHGSTPTVQWDYAGMGVDAVIAGDEHLYERLQVDGIPYFVNGLGGADWLYEFMTPLPQSQARFNGDNGAMRVTVSSECMGFEFVTKDGVVVDRQTLNLNEQPSSSLKHTTIPVTYSPSQ